MQYFRQDPDGPWVAGSSSEWRFLHSDPVRTPRDRWQWGKTTSLQGDRWAPPLNPGKIVAVGRSYADHAKELGNEVPEEPLLFLKSISSLVGHGGTVWLPPESQSVHFEGEVALVIGRQLQRASELQARSGIWGVTAACDVTARDLQRGDRTFTRGKSFDTFCPLGPCIDDALDLDRLTLTTRVNGKVRQQGTVGQLLWPLTAMLSYISRYLTLEPGDVVLTGTPPGVGELNSGDHLEVDVSGLVLSHPVRNRPR